MSSNQEPGPATRAPIETVPTYDYQCRSCGQITEVVHSMSEDGPATCERCGGPLRRVLYPTGIIFKGSGFYSTDSRSTGTGGRRSSTTKPRTDGADTGSSPTTGSSEPAPKASHDASTGGETA